jgi:hypothetical protein
MSDDRTVYILGAGLSRASEFRLPLMSELLSDLDPTCFGSQDEADRVSEWLHKHFSKVQLRDAEDVLTFLDCALSSHLFDLDSQEELRPVQRSLISYLGRRLRHNKKTNVLAPSELCKKLLERLRDEDTIITFNYDSIVEHTLSASSDRLRDRLRQEYVKRSTGIVERGFFNWGDRGPELSLPKAELDQGRILHLHGSVDWTTCENPSCSNYDTVDASRFLHSLRGGVDSNWDQYHGSCMHQVWSRSMSRDRCAHDAKSI